MKVLYILYQLFIALPILLVLTILTAIVTIIGSWIGDPHFWGYYPGKSDCLRRVDFRFHDFRLKDPVGHFQFFIFKIFCNTFNLMDKNSSRKWFVRLRIKNYIIGFDH